MKVTPRADPGINKADPVQPGKMFTRETQGSNGSSSPVPRAWALRSIMPHSVLQPGSIGRIAQVLPERKHRRVVSAPCGLSQHQQSRPGFRA